jgi:PAS domain S-box-containing protein
MEACAMTVHKGSTAIDSLPLAAVAPRPCADVSTDGPLSELLQFKAALDAHALVAITDAQGQITYVNDKFCAVSKWPREELIGRDHRVVNSGHHPTEFFRSLWTTIRAGQVWQGEIRNRARDGSLYWVDTTIVPLLGTDGKPASYIAIRTEITQRKLLEERNAEMVDELLAANRELTEFAYVVSHDLKAPLRGISSLASWLVTDYGDTLGEEGSHQLNLIASRVKRLSGLIDAILAYSRAGRDQADRLPVATEPLVRNTIDLLAAPPHIRIDIVGELPELTIEAVKMQQVFQNLLSNAIDFMDKPAGLITVACQRQASAWHFTVCDNGPGIAPRHFERIFQLFQTLATRDERERTGVGLALVKKIVEIEGGRVWVESTPGKGAAFHFTLPAETTVAGAPLLRTTT